MATSERGTKRTDPDTGKKFYDLNQDPIVSPYTGKSFPRSFFDQQAGKASPATARKVDDEDETEEEEETEQNTGPEIVSLEDADAEESGDDIPDVEDVEVEEDIGDDDEDVFLEEDEDEDDGLGFEVGDDEDR
ncbi:MAG: TIGR02300 family protein [Devosia sp.]|uniref:TIGR02300 family protein n=1 Tax=Devosia sp. TaxID=1871048 RepID=UPI0024C52BAA|nr:TIGR02300 family protein [Devosia sp.]UYN98856.1 MAG: TIGR02300 family protein [Devosia sp.]